VVTVLEEPEAIADASCANIAVKVEVLCAAVGCGSQTTVAAQLVDGGGRKATVLVADIARLRTRPTQRDGLLKLQTGRRPQHDGQGPPQSIPVSP